jgi:hypothetical protein
MKRMASSAAAMALAAVALVGTAGPSSATTDHCEGHTTADKVELDYETTKLYLPPGTTVCYKAGTQVETGTANKYGVLRSKIYNTNGERMAFSYYIVTGYCPPYGS